MPRDTLTNDLNQQAFEFVIGTLRGAERRAFAQKMAEDAALEHQVHFWEEHLMALPDPTPVAPAANTWQSIATKLSSEPTAAKIYATPINSFWWRVKSWLLPGALGSICTVLVVLLVLKFSVNTGSEYIAVLNDQQGRPALTAITQGESAHMRIQWQPLSIAADKNLQLWAISKRDGQARSLAVFTEPNGEKLQLNTAQLRLIKDADSLLLTAEDSGGSAIDEPSSAVIAKGICVRFAVQ